MRFDDLNNRDAAPVTRELLRCCGSTRWALRMATSRPFSSASQMAETADAIWSALDPADWLEAFAAHPRIGERKPEPSGGSEQSGERGTSGRTGWSGQEQAGTRSASDDERKQLIAANREYEARFGYKFIVCATGKSAGEMLAVLQGRLKNDPAQELREAAEEQRKITRLRLSKLLNE
jgi:OHCU decarboxylase